MKHVVSRDLHRYWDDLRAGGAAPERSDIDPAAIRHILAYTFILDVAGPTLIRARDVRFRLSGTRLNALFGRDLRGSGFDRIWTVGDRRKAEAALDGVLEDRDAMVASASGAPPGYGPIGLELMLLPLRHHGKTQSRILGSLASPEAPNWMGLSAAAPLDLLSVLRVPERPSGGGADRGAVIDRGRALPSSEPRRATSEPRQIGPFRLYLGERGGRRSDGPRR